MKFQVILFKRKQGGNREFGIAKMRTEFDSCGVEYAIDANGNKVEGVWDYRLVQGPLCYIQLPE